MGGVPGGGLEKGTGPVSPGQLQAWRKAGPHPAGLVFSGEGSWGVERLRSSFHHITGCPGLEPRDSDSWSGALLLHLHVFRGCGKKKVSPGTTWPHCTGWSSSRITDALGVDQMRFCGSKALLQYRIQNFPNNQCSKMISKRTDADPCTQRWMAYFVTASGSEWLTRKMTCSAHPWRQQDLGTEKMGVLDFEVLYIASTLPQVDF